MKTCLLPCLFVLFVAGTSLADAPPSGAIRRLEQECEKAGGHFSRLDDSCRCLPGILFNPQTGNCDQERTRARANCEKRQAKLVASMCVCENGAEFFAFDEIKGDCASLRKTAETKCRKLGGALDPVRARVCHCSDGIDIHPDWSRSCAEELSQHRARCEKLGARLRNGKCDCGKPYLQPLEPGDSHSCHEQEENYRKRQEEETRQCRQAGGAPGPKGCRCTTPDFEQPIDAAKETCNSVRDKFVESCRLRGAVLSREECTCPNGARFRHFEDGKDTCESIERAAIAGCKERGADVVRDPSARRGLTCQCRDGAKQFEPDKNECCVRGPGGCSGARVTPLIQREQTKKRYDFLMLANQLKERIPADTVRVDALKVDYARSASSTFDRLMGRDRNAFYRVNFGFTYPTEPEKWLRGECNLDESGESRTATIYACQYYSPEGKRIPRLPTAKPVVFTVGYPGTGVASPATNVSRKLKEIAPAQDRAEPGDSRSTEAK